MLKGVTDVKVGYTGGIIQNPTYEQVCTQESGHAESYQVTFDPKIISLETLLKVFWQVHDPTSLNKQGNDIGTQYRSEIFYNSQEQKKIAEESINQAQKDFDKPIVTKITPYKIFYPAESYHQSFYEKNKSYPYCSIVISQKILKFLSDPSNKQYLA